MSAQIGNIPVNQNNGVKDIAQGINGKAKKDSIKRKVKKYPVTDYKYFNMLGDSMHVDTILTIRHLYNLQYTLKDDFTKLPFENMGQAYNDLSLDLNNDKGILSGFVAPAKYANYLDEDEIYFYHVPTPYSDLTYKSGIYKGQMLQSLISVNVHPKLNLSLGYKGISSQGSYQYSIVSAGRFFSSLNYQSKQNRYSLQAYFVTHDISNEENGGIADVSNFDQGGAVFKDRGRIPVNLNNAKNLLKGQRYYIGQKYKLFKSKDVYLLNQTKYHRQTYDFEQSSPSELLGSASIATNIKDSVYLKRFENFLGVTFNTKKFLVQTGINYVHQDYSLDSVKVVNGQALPKNLIDNKLFLASKLSFNWKRIYFNTKLDLGFTSSFPAYYFQADAHVDLPRKILFQAQLKSISKRPDYRFVLYQSAYDKYNWYQPDLKNELIQEISASLSQKKWGKLVLKQQLINNYHYFGSDSLPKTSASGIGYTALQYAFDYNYHKIGFSTDLLLQKVVQGADILSLPTYVARGSVYFQNRYFHKNLFVQTGISFKYFEAYYAKSYNPVLADFLLQNTQKIGGYPIVDIFFNFKVKRFRFFVNAAHVNALFESQKPTYYTAPLYPYRDFNLRLGLRWIFFN